MKKASVLVLALLIVVTTTSVSFADTAVQKLGRGVANILTSPLEIPKGIEDATKEDGFVAGVTWGVAEGLLDFVKRLAVGAYEVVSFPIPLPKHYKPILTDPEYFFEEEIAIFDSDM